MQIYAECDICGKWDDLTLWHKLPGHGVCLGCADKLDDYRNSHRTKTLEENYTTVKGMIQSKLGLNKEN